MKPLIFVSVVVCTLIIGSVAWTSRAATDGHKQKAMTEFFNPVIVQGVTLPPGKYLFVHDDAAMNRGEACTFIYKGETEDRSKLAASFHCIHVERTMAKKFVVRSRETAPGRVELIEFQFAGETAAHAVPIPQNTAVVTLVN
jgi:hypothetical protein